MKNKFLKFLIFFGLVVFFVFLLKRFWLIKKDFFALTLNNITNNQDNNNNNNNKEKSESFFKNLKSENIGEKEVLLSPDYKKVTFNWKYKRINYSLEYQLNNSFFDYYSSRNKAYHFYGKVPENWEEKYYGIFFENAKNDKTLEQVVEKLNEIKIKDQLIDDQLVELVTAFVQAIEYDSVKAKNILEGENQKPRFPFEVLYEGKGICSDKSFLLIALLRKIGYGTAILEYEKENHMAVGIQCPLEYSIDNSGYCFIETTTRGHRVGVIPYLDQESKAVVKSGREYLGENDFKNNQNNNSLIKPSTAKVYQKTEGKVYQGIPRTLNILKELEDLENSLTINKNEIAGLKRIIDEKEKEANQLENNMKEEKKKKNFSQYNNLVNEYNNLVKELKDKINLHNNRVAEYNQKVDRYNFLLEDF